MSSPAPEHRQQPARPADGACQALAAERFVEYFESNAAYRRRSDAAKAICRTCVVLEPCRQRALNMAEPIPHGVMGGATAWELRRARQWRNYELGFSEALPQGSRPQWLERPDAVDAPDASIQDPSTQRATASAQGGDHALDVSAGGVL